MMNERQQTIAEALLMRRLRSLVRIDEDTYVDTEYINHVEYQLFLDEKYALGESCVPDHWLSNTFPKGMGRLPIVGVRSSDAIAFCTWLTEHAANINLGNWRYRLPRQGEFVNFDQRDTHVTNPPIGYWVQNVDNVFFESTVRSLPTCSKDRLENYFAGARRRVLSLAPVRTRTRADGRTRADTRARALDHAFDHAYTLALDRVLDLDRNLALALTLDRTLVHVHNSVPDLARAIERTLDYDLYRTLHHTLNRSIANRDALAPRRNDLRLVFLLIAGLLTEFNEKKYEQEITHALALYVDFVVLEERISGRLPAYEGIRIVKERVKEG